MPFTVSHAAAVLPLPWLTRGRTALVPSALVVGSMAPDLPYYVPQPFPGGLTHQWLSGVLGVDLLLGFAAFTVWHVLVAPALVMLAPRVVRLRLPADAGSGLLRFLRPVPLLITVLSLAVGAATHVGWDAFTHSGRWGAEHLAWLAGRHGRFLGWQWTQLGSSVVGLAVLAGWLLAWWRRTSPTTGEVRPEPALVHGLRLPGTPARLAAATVVLAAAAFGAGYGLVVWQHAPGLHGLAWYTLTGAGSAAGAAGLLVATVTRSLVGAASAPDRRQGRATRTGATELG